MGGLGLFGVMTTVVLEAGRLDHPPLRDPLPADPMPADLASAEPEPQPWWLWLSAMSTLPRAITLMVRSVA